MLLGFDEDHQDGPLLSASEWNDKLRHNHFSGTDVVVKDYESSAHECSLLISRPVEQKPQRRPALIEIRALGFHHLPLQLQAFLQKEGYTCKHASWDFSQVSTDVTYIILDAGGRPVLEDPSEGEFTGVTSLLTQARRILWVSVDQDGSPDVKPERGLIEGLARVARAENKTLELVTMSIVQATKDNLSSSLEAICQVFGRSFGDDSPPNELEYRKVGELKVQRLLPDTNIQHFVNSDHQSQPMQALFHQQIRPLKLHVANPGLLDSMIFVDDDVARTDLCPDEVEIKARAYGINFKDVFIALGQMREQEMTGECAGIVTRVGSSLPSQFKVGDRVCGWRGTPYASHPRFKATNVSHIPDSMSFETAASLPVVYMTAYYSLVEVARLSKGDKVLIHAASGGVGQAAVQIAQTYEAEIFATVGSVAKKELVKEKYGILDSHIFSSRARTFKSGIMRLTQGEGVDVVLNSLSGDYLQETWDCIAMFGTFIEIGKTDIYRNQQIHMKPFDRNVNFSSVDLVLLADHKPHAMKKVFGEIMLMFQTGRLKPVHPVTIVPIGEAVDTFRLIQARKHVGKLVLQATETAMVKATALKREPFVLNGNATYLIAGGRGSLGRSIVRYMIDHGAKHLVIFSRRDMKSHEELLFVQDVKSSDVEILLMTCDITSAASVKQAVMSIERSMPPIKGVVQAAMVLQDQLLERMSVDAYKQALRPKMLGTRNLVDALVDNVFDFFIMLSSASSIIGLSGQANYAAGCAYQDALAQSCSYTNAHYVSLNLGMVEETDIIASRPEFRQAWLRAGFIPIAVQDVLNLLEYAMSGQARKDDCRQISIGFNIESLSQPSASDVLKNPIFCHLPLSSDTTKAKPGLQTQLDVSDALLAAKSTEEIHTITASAISKKMAALISLGEEGIGVEVPISSLGLDSLIAIELKNWIVQTFHSPLQTSEILDSPNIISLAGTVAKRSTVLSNKMETSLTEASQAVPDQSQDSSHQRLPTIPLPNLTDSLNQYIESVQSFCSAEDMESLLAAMNRFQGPDGRGQELHQRLLARMKDPTLDDWLYDLYQHETWTKRRVPLNPYGHFFGALRSSDVKHSQAQWAAIITEAAFRFKQRLQAGDIDRDYMNEQPLDMNLHNWTFNTWLEAGTENDKIRKEGIDNHIIVLRNGHIFRVVLDRALSSPSDLEAQFENILNASNSVVPSLATLTADGRESWAGIRKIVAVADPKNESLLQLIETSAFVVCLDDFSPSTSSERVNCFLLGGPSNRWSDKSLQFVVCSNGASAGIAEHAMLDGDTLNQLWDAINLAISNKGVEGRVEANSRSKEDVQELEEYSFHITPEIEGHINRVHDLFYKDFTEYEYTHHTLSTLGSSLLRAHKLAPKVVFQIIIQLAGRLYFGESHPCLEPVSMRPFHKGRLDFIQTTIPPVFDFLVSAATALERHRQSGSQTQPSTDNTRSPLTPAAEDLNLRTRLLDAAKALSNLITNTTRGRGFRNHFLALRAMVRPEEGEEMPDFFKHPSFGLIGPGRISTDCLSRHGKVTEAGFHRPGPWKVWVHYEVGDEGWVSLLENFLSILGACSGGRM
ncbi:MAG: hypothetical protein LQ340_003186 [Diploschistes diacapsis]|nr:MAG: hypothetical protein LQ340_003186 [Diploschistes diacapsis]